MAYAFIHGEVKGSGASVEFKGNGLDLLDLTMNSAGTRSKSPTSGVHRAVAMIRTVNVTKKPRVLLIRKHLRYE